jgi:predicted RNA binding protein YcfA (HicA-like mRNA interferase family)
MSRYEKLISRLLQGDADSNMSFDDLCNLLQRLGFEMRTRGSHHIFRKSGIEERINLQRDDDKAKVYQVRQIRSIILKYNLKEVK